MAHKKSCPTALRHSEKALDASKLPPVPRCMLADKLKGLRKKLKSSSTKTANKASMAIKKLGGRVFTRIPRRCKDMDEEKCLMEAALGNCKWCELLCGGAEV